MIEFTLVMPVLFFILFGIFEYAIMMFDLGATRFAAAEGAKVEAQVGSGLTKCSLVPDCTRVFGTALVDCNADCQAISAINRTAVGTTSLEEVTEIDVVKLASDGSFVPVANTLQQYTLSGASAGSATYPPSGRDTGLGTSDYLSVVIKFTYHWRTGIFSTLLPAPQMQAAYSVRLEPQKY
jgi:hypothetical protein